MRTWYWIAENFLLEEIVKRISRYEYCDNASANISGMVLRPKNPSIYYMHKTFKELNDFYNIITNERNYRKKLYDEAKAIRKYYEKLEKV